MNCCICKNHPKFTCSCISPNVFICNDHLDLHTSEPGNHVFRISKKTDLLPIIFDDLKMIKIQIIANPYFQYKKILNLVNKNMKKVKRYIKNSEKNLNTNEANLLKMIFRLKNLNFINFEDLENKYLYRILQENDGIYKGKIGFGQNDAYIKEGKGYKEYKNGKFFEGEWKNNKREGKGILKYTNGNVYEGEFKNDTPEGKGILKYVSGAIYEGEFKNNKAEGKGIYKYANGIVYDGEFKKGLKEGKGIFKYLDGKVFKGEFKKDKKEGKGIYIAANGTFLKGLWKDNILLKME